jgi:hypothetical protein
MRAYWGAEVELHALLTSALDGDESASRPGSFTSREKAPGTQWIEGWVGPTAGGEEKNSQPLPGPRPPDHRACSTELSWLSFRTCFSYTRNHILYHRCHSEPLVY